MLEKANMKTRTLKTTAMRADAGFTAIEIAMVAAVIAILSLIVLPIFRNRVEDAKIAAAQADLSALMKAEQVVKADIDAYARLEDLDNVELFGYQGTLPNGLDKEVPDFIYKAPDPAISPDPNSRYLLKDQAERTKLAGAPGSPKWRGPYIAFQRSIKLEDLRSNTVSQVGQYLLRSQVGSISKWQAAIQDLSGEGLVADGDKSRIPTDPWGQPYLFFPPTGNSPNGNSTGNPGFASAVIYSLGPNGAPGDGTQSTNGAAYSREYTVTSPGPAALGQGDDLMVEF